MSRVSVATLILLSVGCGGAKQAESETAEKPAKAAAPKSKWEPAPLPDSGPIKLLGLTGPDKPWDDMSYDEQEWYMIGKVHPVMRQVFQTFNEKKYEGEKFECVPATAKSLKRASTRCRATTSPRCPRSVAPAGRRWRTRGCSSS